MTTRRIPPTLYRLGELARNLWWSWHPDVIGTFRELDPVRWRQLGHNPVALLAEFSPERLERRADELVLRSPAERRKRGLRLLSESEPGSRYVVASVYERDRQLLEFFENEGIRPGARISVEARNYDGTVSLSIDKHQIRLGTLAAERVWVSKV